MRAALVAVACALLACDPGRFDDRPPSDDGASGMDGSTDAGMDAATDGQRTNVLDAELSQADAEASDGGAPASDASTVCVAPRGGQTLPLVVVPNSLHVIARVPNPSGVAARHVVAIKPQATRLLWTIVTTPAATSMLDGGVKQAPSYPSIAHTSTTGPWSSASSAGSPASTLMLDESVAANGLPIPLVPDALQPLAGYPVVPVGLVVRDGVATLFLKAFVSFTSAAMFTGTLNSGDYALRSKPQLLFPLTQSQPAFGTGAFDRMNEVYAFGCVYNASDTSTYPCWIGRASDQALADSTSYETYRASPAAQEGWGKARDGGTPVVSGDENMSLSFNKHLGLWLAVTSGGAGADTNQGTVYLRSAPLPEGPWSLPVAVPLPSSAASVPARLAVEHPDLAENCGQRLVISYQEPRTPVFFGQPETGTIALLTIDLQ